MLELKNVSKFYYNKGVIASGFSKVNLKLNIGEFVAITGESGSGKSTLLNVISGLDSYEEGEMYIYGKETSHYTEKDFEVYRKKYVSNIFQAFNLVNSYTVYQNIELVLLLNGYKKKDIKNKVIDLIKKVDLYKFRKTKVSKLSGGQKQRVAIARALARETPIIIADEPTGNLDSKSSKEIIKLLSEIAKDKLVIVVTHNYEQVEAYVTRKITMHDGRILEDKVIREVEATSIDEKELNLKNIRFFNQIRLGIRNTFNIFTKFALLFAVFLFITIAFVSEYASFKKQEFEQQKLGYNWLFQDTSIDRIIINKIDKTPFTGEDYDALEAIEDVDHIEKNDLLLDQSIGLTDEGNIYVYGKPKKISEFNGEPSVGRKPENNNEVIIETLENDYYIKGIENQVLDNTCYLVYNDGYMDKNVEIKIVGINYTKEITNVYSTESIYISEQIFDKLRFEINEEYSTMKVLFLNKYYESEFGNFMIITNDRVPQGSAYVSYDLVYYNNGYSIINKPLKIEVDNLFYKDEIELKIAKTYTKNNFKSVLGLTDYDAYSGAVFINPNDYNSLFNKESYQSSIFVKDIDKIEDIKTKLNEMGYKTFIMKDSLVDNGISQAIILGRTAVTAGLLVAAFFITYFVIKIILKSRNVYFSTIRILGASQKIAKKLLIIELFIVSNLAFIAILGMVVLQSKNIINIDFINTVLEYFKIKDFIILYVMLTGMSYLISIKYAKKLFKNSTMKTYNEEV